MRWQFDKFAVACILPYQGLLLVVLTQLFSLILDDVHQVKLIACSMHFCCVESIKTERDYHLMGALTRKMYYLDGFK